MMIIGLVVNKLEWGTNNNLQNQQKLLEMDIYFLILPHFYAPLSW